MSSFDQELSRLVRELNALGGQASLPPVERDRSGRLRLDVLLARIREAHASDLLLVAGVPATARVDGRLLAADPEVMDGAAVESLARELLDERLQNTLLRDGSVDFCFERSGLGRFRCNAHRQKNGIALAIRSLPRDVPDLASLGLPAAVARFAELDRGLVLVAGPAGCGKSTTLAALVSIMNRSRNAHVITVEDPIEHVHAHGTCIVEQMEVGRDTPGFAAALRGLLRQDPDVILVGEMRDQETMAMALTAAETGHLVFSTLHTADAAQTLDRIVDVFPDERQPQIRAQLALSLAGIVTQHLVPRADGPGRVPAVEILVVNDAVRHLIRRGLNHRIPAQIAMGRAAGMTTLDASLAKLVREGKVTREEATRRASHPEEFDGYVG